MITGHIATYDTMGISGLFHPLACKARYSGSQCPVTHALVHGETRGYCGKGSYIAILVDDVVHLTPTTTRLEPAERPNTAYEIEDLLDAFFEEVGPLAGYAAISTWIQRRRMQAEAEVHANIGSG